MMDQPLNEQHFHQHGIRTAYLSYPALHKATAGTILRRCLSQVQDFRKNIGQQVCVFKVGLTAEPTLRFAFYKELNYTHMSLLHASRNLGLIQMLEAALIAFLMDERGCRNQRYGGECPPSTEQKDTFFVYVVGSRADQFKPIG